MAFLRKASGKARAGRRETGKKAEGRSAAPYSRVNRFLTAQILNGITKAETGFVRSKAEGALRSDTAKRIMFGIFGKILERL